MPGLTHAAWFLRNARQPVRWRCRIPGRNKPYQLHVERILVLFKEAGRNIFAGGNMASDFSGPLPDQDSLDSF